IDGRQTGYHPESGFVPNAEVAIAIAVSVWEPIYGKEHIAKQAPYFAYEVKGYWVVQGTLPPAPPGHIVVGGTAKAIIEKRTGKVIHVIHHE
ncbi:MAG: NTF2 fold immunity protein, partial [Desulfatiglandales bacterium]